MEDMGGVVHTGLEGAVNVGEARSRRAEAHPLAEVVATFVAEGTGAAVDASLDGDALTNLEVSLGAAANGAHDACRLVTEDKGCADGEVTVAAVAVVVDCGGTRGQ